MKLRLNQQPVQHKPGIFQKQFEACETTVSLRQFRSSRCCDFSHGCLPGYNELTRLKNSHLLQSPPRTGKMSLFYHPKTHWFFFFFRKQMTKNVKNQKLNVKTQ